MYLVHSGHIDSSTRGVWRLTEKGQHEDLDGLDVASLFKGVQSTFKPSPEEGFSARNYASVDAAESKFEAQETALLPVIKALPPEGFERLELGVRPKVVYEVDMDFFDGFQ